MFGMGGMFQGEHLTGISDWEVTFVFNMESMFQGATAFDRDLGEWDGTFTNFLADAELSPLQCAPDGLDGWADLPCRQQPVHLHRGTARASIMHDGWTIIDSDDEVDVAVAFAENSTDRVTNINTMIRALHTPLRIPPQARER